MQSRISKHFILSPHLDLDQAIAGELNAVALRYVTVGGGNDQSLCAGGRVEYALKLQAHAAQELTFLAAWPGGSVRPPSRPDGLDPRKAAPVRRHRLAGLAVAPEINHQLSALDGLQETTHSGEGPSG